MRSDVRMRFAIKRKAVTVTADPARVNMSGAHDGDGKLCMRTVKRVDLTSWWGVVCLVYVVMFLSGTVAHGYGNDASTKGGVSASVKVGAAWVSTSDQLKPNSDNRRTNTLQDDSDSFDEAVPIVLFDVRYGVDEHTEVYCGTPLEEFEPSLMLGVSHDLGTVGTLDVAGFYAFGQEVWADPYVTGADRVETDAEAYGGKIVLEDVFETRLSLGYKVSLVDVENDVIGNTYPDLRRDGTVHEASLGYGATIDDGSSITPVITYTLADIDGASQRYRGYGLRLLFVRATSRYAVRLFAGVSRNEYDKMHPMFKKVREDTLYRAGGVFTWFDPFGFEDTSVTLGAFWGKRDANIGFFESATRGGILTVGYRF